uniref:Gag-Pol polyprotein n=1 Tax=Tanacetum cinerariifolium TaxID=118510 RepID=A0A6L2JMX0_TANCI|nr:hypothetical protein [Tanacetum cinerariifolium]
MSHTSTITNQKPGERELDLLFEAMYDDYIGGQPSAAPRTAPTTLAPQVLQTLTSFTTTADTAVTLTNSSLQSPNIPNTSHDVDELKPQQHAQQQDNQAPLQPEIVADNVPNAMFDGGVFENPFAPPATSAAESSSSQYDHPLEQVIGETSQPVLTRNQLKIDGKMCIYALTVSTMEPRNVKEAMIDPAWIDSMQKELLQFKRIDLNRVIKGRINKSRIEVICNDKGDISKGKAVADEFGKHFNAFLGIEDNYSQINDSDEFYSKKLIEEEGN